MSRSSNTLALY